MDTIKPWCVYSTNHPSGLVYQGKGKTALVLAGKYTGSGVRYNLALTLPEYAPGTWTTTVLATFDTEDEAYEAEEKLVTYESLADPFRLNMMQGGRKGKYKTPSTLLKKYRAEAKRGRALSVKLKRQEKAAEMKAKVAAQLKAAKQKSKRMI